MPANYRFATNVVSRPQTKPVDRIVCRKPNEAETSPLVRRAICWPIELINLFNVQKKNAVVIATTKRSKLPASRNVDTLKFWLWIRIILACGVLHQVPTNLSAVLNLSLIHI